MASGCKINSSETSTDRQEVTNAVANGNSSATTIYRVDSHCSHLCQALFKLTTGEPQLCDVTLKLHGANKEFKAHSPVLAACSSFFKGILDKPEHQHVKNVVIVLPEFIEASGLEPLLLFIYTGDLGINRENLTHIYQVAVLFELPAALALCNKYVETQKLPPSTLSSVCRVVGPSLDRQYFDSDNSVVPLDVITCSLEEEHTQEIVEESGRNAAEEQNLTIGTIDKRQQHNHSSEGLPDSTKCRIEGATSDVVDDYNPVVTDSHKSPVPSPQAETAEVEVNGATIKQMVHAVTKRQVVSRLKKGVTGHVKRKAVSKEDASTPVRRSMRRLAGTKRKLPTGSALSGKRNVIKRKAIIKAKAKIPPVKRKYEVRARKTPTTTNEEKSPEVPPAVLLPKIDPNLKFTDPAKYIAELIDKNSDMLNKPGSDNHGGGVQLATRGKITFIFPEGSEVTLPPLDVKQTTTPPAPDIKVNAYGLPYEKIVDPLTCSECSITFATSVQREQHLEEKHSGLVSSTKQVMFQCLSCSFSTDFLRNMWFHCHWKHAYPLPDTLRQYCCGLCDYRAPAQGNIEVHIRRVHTHERPLMCDVCGQFFKSLDTLRGHRFYRHQDIFPFQCNVCEKQFKRRHKLDVHMRIHMGYKPFGCPECQYATYTKFNLKDHMRKRHLKELDHVSTA